MNQLLFHITQEMMTNLSGQQRPLVEEDYIRLRQSLSDIEGILQRVMVPPPPANVVVAPVVAPVIAPVIAPVVAPIVRPVVAPVVTLPRRNPLNRMVTPPPRNQHQIAPERPQRVQPVRQVQNQTYEQAVAPFYERLHNQRRRKIVVKSKVLKKSLLDATMEDICGICMDSHKKRDTIETSCCKHSFGAECFKTYQRTTRTCPCPICRNETFEIMEFRARKPSRVTTPATTPATATNATTATTPAENTSAPPADIVVPTNVPIVDVPIVNLVDVV